MVWTTTKYNRNKEPLLRHDLRNFIGNTIKTTQWIKFYRNNKGKLWNNLWKPICPLSVSLHYEYTIVYLSCY